MGSGPSFSRLIVNQKINPLKGRDHLRNKQINRQGIVQDKVKISLNLSLWQFNNPTPVTCSRRLKYDVDGNWQQLHIIGWASTVAKAI